MVSIFSPHFFNWTEQLRDSGHEIYWLDVYDSNTYVKKINFVEQIIGWKYRWDYPGRYYIKKLPLINELINRINEKELEDIFEEKFLEINPDVVHSFVLYLSCTPILRVMQKHAEKKWIYSSWGSDLYYFQNEKKHLEDIQRVLPRINYLFTDCQRDYSIANQCGFSGKFLGVFPGGGGYQLENYSKFLKSFESRDIILIKGYQGRSGRAIAVLKAIRKLESILSSFEVIVFGADKELLEFLDKTSYSRRHQIDIFEKIPHSKVLELMGRSLIYIGNSISDGMPNTLLEAIIMGVFPIQSNPGGATAEIIEDGKNGLLIHDPENSDEIAMLLKKAIDSPEMLKSAITINTQKIKPRLKRNHIKEQVLNQYYLIEKELKC